MILNEITQARAVLLLTCMLSLRMLGKTDLTTSHAMLYTNQWAVLVYSGSTISVGGGDLVYLGMVSASSMVRALIQHLALLYMGWSLILDKRKLIKEYKALSYPQLG